MYSEKLVDSSSVASGMGNTKTPNSSSRALITNDGLNEPTTVGAQIEMSSMQKGESGKAKKKVFSVFS